tara:strand:- start:6448 stop:7413 length:966 start_codon:yes stop_codon:yes gene_type:complete
MKTILITGCAGFIGYHLAKKFIKKNFYIVGIDSINNYYDQSLKKNRVKNLRKYKNFKFYKINLINKKKIIEIFRKEKIYKIFHLAAQAGVRHSLTNPHDYIDNNISVFLNIIQIANKFKIKEIFYASSSSVYGQQKNIDLKENLEPKPIQFYAVSKLTNENMAEVYSSLYNIRFIGMRFFTVYGPWGRPDMALFKFTKSIIENKKINLFNHGLHRRNFSYVDDVVEMIFRLSNIKIKRKHEIFNIANKNNYALKEYIYWIEKIIGKKSKKQFLKLQQGDVPTVRADINKIIKLTKFKKFTTLAIGVKNFVNWYKDYYNVKN